MLKTLKENGPSGLRAKTNAYFAKLQKSGEPIWFYKTVGGRFSRAGVPDFLVCYNGLFGALELKTPGQRPTPAQERELGAIRITAHGLAGVASDMAGVERFVTMLRAGPTARYAG